MHLIIEPRFCPSCGHHMRGVGPAADVILSDRSLECQACGRRVAVHTSWARTSEGHYVVVGWIVRNLRDGELVDEPAPEGGAEVRADEPPGRPRGWLRGSPASFALRARLD